MIIIGILFLAVCFWVSFFGILAFVLAKKEIAEKREKEAQK